MTWNWQKPDWPHFSWDAVRLAKAAEQFVWETGVFAGTVKHIGPEDREQLTVEAMSSEALTTSEIEGEILDRASVQSSIRQHLGLAGERRRARPEIFCKTSREILIGSSAGTNCSNSWARP